MLVIKLIIFFRLLEYIVGDNKQPGLVPHKIKDTISVNEARRVIIQLAQPMADISELICNNLSQIERHKREINKKNQTIDQLKKNLYIPQVDIQQEEFTQPRTVCTSAKCRKIYQVSTNTYCLGHISCQHPLFPIRIVV